MDSDLTISSEQVQADVPVTVFHLRGWLDAQSEGQLLEAARTAHDDGERHGLRAMSVTRPTAMKKSAVNTSMPGGERNLRDGHLLCRSRSTGAYRRHVSVPRGSRSSPTQLGSVELVILRD